MKPILAILVIYKMSLSESPTYVSLSRAMEEDPSLSARLRLLICDNSPAPQPLPVNFTGSYLHDRRNPGLAARYNYATNEAGDAAWLLLLDQDTRITTAWLQEMLAAQEQQEANAEIVTIVPRLVSEGRMLSPHLPSFRPGSGTFDDQSYGPSAELLRVFNSGALVRISALRAAGGFPEEYWLDYLDHAVFHRLQAAGGRIFVLRSQLEHEMTHLRAGSGTNEAAGRRHSNQLAAELRFYREFGSPAERSLHRRDLARKALHAFRGGHLAHGARLLKAALSPAPTGRHTA